MDEEYRLHCEFNNGNWDNLRAQMLIGDAAKSIKGSVTVGCKSALGQRWTIEGEKRDSFSEQNDSGLQLLLTITKVQSSQIGFLLFKFDDKAYHFEKLKVWTHCWLVPLFPAWWRHHRGSKKITNSFLRSHFHSCVFRVWVGLATTQSVFFLENFGVQRPQLNQHRIHPTSKDSKVFLFSLRVYREVSECSRRQKIHHL